MKTVLRRILTTMILMAAALLPLTDANAQTPKVRIEGAWEVVLTQGDSTLKFHYTFAPGKTTGDGTLTFSSDLDAGPGVICTPSLGAWKRINANQFLATSKTTCNEKGFIFTIKTFDTVTVNDSNSAFTGSTTFVGFDQNGDQIFVDQGNLNGTIFQASPPQLFMQIPDAPLQNQTQPRRLRKP